MIFRRRFSVGRNGALYHRGFGCFRPQDETNFRGTSVEQESRMGDVANLEHASCCRISRSFASKGEYKGSSLVLLYSVRCHAIYFPGLGGSN